MQNGESVSLPVLFLMHAKGFMTNRALEERRKEIIQYMTKNKYTISDETLKELDLELAEISKQLGES